MAETQSRPSSNNTNALQSPSSNLKGGSGPIGIPTRNDGWVPNPRDLSTTPGGTIYATTPGGTKIVYDRNQLLFLRQSPLSKTPPINLVYIPGVTCCTTCNTTNLSQELPNGNVETTTNVIKVPRRDANSKSGGFWYQLDFRKYVRGVVYGGTDGIITIFAVVAGVSGASLSTAILLILGVATLVSDALSMAVSDYLSSTAEEDVRIDKERQLSRDYESNLTLYKEKLTKLFHSRGFTPDEVDLLVNTISKNKKMTVDLLIHEEERSEESASSPTVSALYTFFSFIFFGFIPLVADILIASMGNTFFAAEHTFFTACFFSGSTLFILGTVKAKFTNKNPFSVGFQMVLIGGVAAVVAYSIAYSMSGLEHQSQQTQNSLTTSTAATTTQQTDNIQ